MPASTSPRRGALAKIYHPDRGGDAAGFNRIKTAYDRAAKLARKTPARPARGHDTMAATRPQPA